MRTINIEVGKIEKVLIKDNYVYVTVRRHGRISDSIDSETGVNDTTLIGALTLIEQDIVLSEVLIPSNIRLSDLTSFPEDLIGKSCVVYMDGKNPLYANITASISQPRKISRRDFGIARSISKDGTIDENSINYLKKIGYKQEEIEKELSEKYIDIGLSNSVLLDKTEGTYSIDQDSKKVKIIRENGTNSSLPKCRKPVIGLGGKI